MRDTTRLDAIAPGVTEAYKQLNAGGMGIQTSLGRYYNHTFFGRDAGMAAKFVTDFDHATAWQTIVSLAACQAQVSSSTTQSEYGRIHHELRDYATWDARTFDTVGLWIAGKFWGAKNKELLTYFAADTTSTYIRLVHKYAIHLDRSIMQRQVPKRPNMMWSLAESIEAAAGWICAQVDDDGIFVVRRTNRWSLPYQTFADSVTAYAWADGTPADTCRPHSFVEVQAYALDALQDALWLLPDSTHAQLWRGMITRMHRALIDRFWYEETSSFAPGLFERNGQLQMLDTEMIMSGWVLNASFWKHLDDGRHRALMIAIVERLFRDDFLTDVGIRTKSSRTREPLGAVIDYHGSQTVWPMFNFMMIEGLRRHGLFRLARQLENRLLNGVNALGGFPEFMIIDHRGQLCRPDKTARHSANAQMIPERNIAFTVVPALTLTYRQTYHRSMPISEGWKHQLEQSILSSMPEVELRSPDDAMSSLQPQALRLRRTVAGLRSAAHIAPVIWRGVSS